MKQTIIKIMKKKQPKWKPIKMGERLPCQSFLRKKSGEILKLSTVAGVKVGQDAYYLPVDDVIEEIRNYPIEESEDEMICRKLIAFLKQCKAVYGDGFKQFDLNIDDAIAWLENQSEHKKFRDNIQVGDKVTRNEDGMLVNLSQLNRVAKKDEKQCEYKPINIITILNDYFANTSKEQQNKDWEELKHLNDVGLNIDIPFGVKDSELEEVSYDIPKGYHAEIEDNKVVIKKGEKKHTEWSDEDYVMQRAALEILMASPKLVSSTILKESVIVWLKSIKERIQPQPKQEWSEEDEDMRDDIIRYLKRLSGDMVSPNQPYQKEIQWLKSLRTQTTWKPSGEQMRVLDLAIRCGINRGTTEETTLVSLFNDLKKLTE